MNTLSSQGSDQPAQTNGASNNSALVTLLQGIVGQSETDWLLTRLAVPGVLRQQTRLDGALLSQALTMALFADLCRRVPDARRYSDERFAMGQQVMLDHGALRTVAAPMQHLPAGRAAFARLLEPLGYHEVGQYPLPALQMCGYVYQHRDYPAHLAQFFISELDPSAFSAQFQAAVLRCITQSQDPLSRASTDTLHTMQESGYLPDDAIDQAGALLSNLLTCFGCQHAPVAMADYQILLAESKEMAWIATEGNAFNHATDRVTDLDAIVAQQRALGRPMKPEIEIGQYANIRQTAYRATPVTRRFIDHGEITERQVPGSFFEFIERGPRCDAPDADTTSDVLCPDQALDLRFDTRNAQGIFTMTRS